MPASAAPFRVPESHRDLLERPLFGHLATIRPDGSAQSNPMWFDWDGSLLRFTNTLDRPQHRNVRGNPSVAFSVLDPEQPYRYLALGGTVERIEPDPEGRLFDRLAERYGMSIDRLPDRPRRVIIVVRPERAWVQ
jgi:PPOX class probable F420-dependent enzyme